MSKRPETRKIHHKEHYASRFIRLRRWMDLLKHELSDSVKILLVATKADLPEEELKKAAVRPRRST